MSRDSEFCKHYRAMSDHDTCCKGVKYSDFKHLKFDQRPCFERNGVAPPGCPLAEFPTQEEREERNRRMNERFARTIVAREAIVESLGGPWRKGMKGSAGKIDCPCCKGEKTLAFSRSGYNGHIHACCTTTDCVQWME